MSRPIRLPVTDAQMRRVAIWIANTAAEEGHAIGRCVSAIFKLHPTYQQLVILIDDVRAITGWELAIMTAEPTSINPENTLVECRRIQNPICIGFHSGQKPDELLRRETIFRKKPDASVDGVF